MHPHRLFYLSTLLLILTACAALGVPKAETFHQKLAGGYTTVAAARDTTATLLSAGRITAADAQNIQNQCDNLRSGLDVARSLHASDPAIGDDKLAAIITGLNTLSAYLASRSKGS